MARNVKLSGFKTTTAILLALPAHSLTAELPPVPVEPVSELSMVASHPTGPAPLSSRFELEGLTEAQWLNCVVKTTFDDPGSTFDVHPLVLNNALLGIRDANVMYGALTSHHFAEARTYNCVTEVWYTV